MKLSILIPVYNEENNLEIILKKVFDVKLSIPMEVIVVDDCSTDNSLNVLKRLNKKYKFKLLTNKINMGKGGALKTAMEGASGDILLFQDSDLEYDPCDYPNLIKPIIEGKADFVLGNRFNNYWKKPHLYDYIHYVGNRFQGVVLSFLYFVWIKDAWTCYKVFKKDLLNNVKINGNRFDYEIELLSKILHKHPRLCHVDIKYNPRSFSEGKKITWRDGVKALIVTLRYRFFKN